MRRSALEGMLAGGLQPSQLVAVSRNPSGQAALAVSERGVQVAPADLDDPSSLQPLLSSIKQVYCHALSGDASAADPQELSRGKALVELLKQNGTQMLVYNGSAGRGSNAGISQVPLCAAYDSTMPLHLSMR